MIRRGKDVSNSSCSQEVLEKFTCEWRAVVCDQDFWQAVLKKYVRECIDGFNGGRSRHSYNFWPLAERIDDYEVVFSLPFSKVSMETDPRPVRRFPLMQRPGAF